MKLIHTRHRGFVFACDDVQPSAPGSPISPWGRNLSDGAELSYSVNLRPNR